MDVFTVDVFVQKDDVRLLSITHPLHIVGGKVAVLLPAQHIIGMGVEGDVDNGFSGVAVCVEIWLEPGHSLGHITSVRTRAYLIGEKHLSGLEFLLVGVVFQDPVQRTAACDPYNHLCLNSSVFAKILPIKSPIRIDSSLNSFSIYRARRSSKTVWIRFVT